MAIVTIVDPVTRIEGHMKVQVTLDTVNGRLQVVDAQCTGTQFRGFESMLVGRDPRDAATLTERICGVCPVSHGLASVTALEAAAGVRPPPNARILRNLVLGANFLQSHLLHFYLLASLDYVNGPAGAPWSPAWNVDLMRTAALQQITDHFTTAATMRRKAHEMGAIFGGRLPSPPAFQAGGFTAKPTAASVAAFRSVLATLTQFIQGTYLPDVQLLASAYADYAQVGRGPGDFLAHGVFDLVDGGATKLLRRGVVYAAAPAAVQGVSTSSIREQVARSWYAASTDNLPPANGQTVTVDPATKPAAYSWLKAPRYDNRPLECGPLARMWVNGDYRSGVSVMDRHLARAQEASKIASAMSGWLDQLVPGNAVMSTYSNPYSGVGEGLTEAPRGALGHWATISGGKLSSYQIITPTCWNASPADGGGVRGPMEQALIGTPVQDAAQPIEVMRVVHSFDPCLSCAVHVMRPQGQAVVIHSPAAA
jgi:hydrogenase large subunit